MKGEDDKSQHGDLHSRGGAGKPECAYSAEYGIHRSHLGYSARRNVTPSSMCGLMAGPPALRRSRRPLRELLHEFVV